jgi:DNA-binding MarR family transcriptional regulator
VSYHLTGKEKRILEEIIASDTVSSQRMYDLVESSTLSYPQNNKIKNDTIKKVNKKIHKILNVKDFIESKKDEKDQRLIIYYTQKAHVFIR